MITILAELKRRNVFRVAGLYAVVAWLIMQVAVLFEDTLNLPAWFDSTVTAALILCFPIALLLTWAFEMTPDGIKPAETADGEVTHSGRKTDIVIVAGLLGVLALGLWQQMTKPDVVYKDKEGTVKSALTAPQQAAIMVEPELQTDSASIAVLPFSDLSPSGDQGYFSDGIAQELLNVLAKVDGLKVASRTSAFAFKGQDALGIPFIAEKLKARNVLKGSVRKSGDMIRITAQLIDADTDMHYLPCCRSQH